MPVPGGGHDEHTLPEEFIDELAGFYVPGIPESDPVTALRVRLKERGFEQVVEVYCELKRKDTGFLPRHYKGL